MKVIKRISDVIKGYWSILDYVLDDSKASSDYGNYLSRCFCRLRGHPCGVWWFSSHSMEPDMTCCGCGEDLG